MGRRRACPGVAKGEAGWTAPSHPTINRPLARSFDPEYAQVAQLVEHATENRSVGGSIPPLGTILPPSRTKQRTRAADELYRPQNAGVVLNRRHLLRRVFATAIWSRACQPVTVPMAR